MVIDVSRVSVFASDLVVGTGILDETTLEVLLQAVELILGSAAAPHRPAQHEEDGADDGDEENR